MTYETYRQIFFYGAIACGVMFLISVALFFWLRIPRVISDLTGRTARKAIKEIRKQNEQGGEMAYQNNRRNNSSGKQKPQMAAASREGTMTQKIATQILVEQAQSDATSVLAAEQTTLLGADSGATTLLGQDPGATTLLNTDSNATTVLNADPGATTVLSADPGATTVLSQNPAEADDRNTEVPFNGFEIEFERTFVHTNEIIEL